MPQPKRPRLKKQGAEKPGDALQATTSAETPAELVESTEVHKEIREEICKDPSQYEIPEVGLVKQGEDVVSDTQTNTPTSPDVVAEALAAAAVAEAAIKRLKADVVITRHMAVAAGAGLIPLPVVDFAAVTAVQLSMLAQICGIYDQKFS